MRVCPLGTDISYIKSWIASSLSWLQTGGEPRLSLKCDPDKAEDLRAAYPAIIPGYHLNKKYWNTLLLDQHLPPKLLSSLIRHSWNEASAKLTKRVRTELGITPLPEED